MVTEKEVKVENWYEEYDKPSETGTQLPIFEMKLHEGQLSRKENIMFLSEGIKKPTRFGEAIIFTIKHDSVDKVWFIKKNQYNLLNPIARKRKEGLLQFREAIVERVGSGQKETKWSIQFK